jgi:hypothetical protein
MGKKWKVYFYWWFVWGFIGTSNAQYIHSLESFQIQVPDSKKAYFPKTYQDNFLSNNVSIDDLIESGLSSQVKESIDLLPRCSDSRFQNALPKNDDFTQIADFRFSSSKVLSTSSGFESINKITLDIYDFNLSQSFPFVSKFGQINSLLKVPSFFDHIDFSNQNKPIPQIENNMGEVNNENYFYSSLSQFYFKSSNETTSPSSAQISVKKSFKSNKFNPEDASNFVNSKNNYPTFTFVYPIPKYFFNVFEENQVTVTDRKDLSTINLSSDYTQVTSNRDRRVAFNPSSTYVWEIQDFNTYDTFDFDDSDSGDLNIYIYPTSSVDTNNDGTSHSTGTSMVSGYNSSKNDFTLMIQTGNFNVTIDESLWHYVHQDWAKESSWTSRKVSDTYYLEYNSNGFQLSVVPEPSTYFMTGALFCMLGCNRQTRKSFKLLFAKLFYKLKLKVSCSSIRKKVS